MKKIFVIGLAVLMILGLSTIAMATDFTVNFAAGDPDVTVTAYKGPAGVYSYEGTASFHLTGTGTATGTVDGSTDGTLWSWGPCPGHPTVSGEYTASGGDFSSTFSAFSYMLDGPSYYGHGYWSTHSIDATGVTDGSMAVIGDATAFSGGGYGSFVEGGQTYFGTAESVTAFASKMDSTKQGIDPVSWDPAEFKGAEFEATATADSDSTVSFVGSTDAGTYPQGGETSPCRVSTKQGLGFALGITGGSLDSLEGSLTDDTDYPYLGLNTTYSYLNAQIEPTLIVGDTSTYFTGTPGGGYYEWEGVPGYLTNPDG